MIFNSAKTHMEGTKLFQIVQRMPKGALLHCHLAAMVDLGWLFAEAINTPGMYMSSSVPLSSPEVRETEIVKIDFSTSITKDAPSIWSPEYPVLTRVPLKAAAESFPQGGKAGFITWMSDRCSITQSEAVQNHLGIDDIWRKLENGFVMITPMVWYEPITRAFLQKFFETLVEDGVRWVEIRGMARKLRLEGQENLAENRIQIPRILKEEIEKFKASEKGKGFWGCRLIWDCLRIFTTEEIITGKFKPFYIQVINLSRY
jgi:adenosine deaminase CECR1